MGTAKTGQGKTLAFLIPVVEQLKKLNFNKELGESRGHSAVGYCKFQPVNTVWSLRVLFIYQSYYYCYASIRRHSQYNVIVLFWKLGLGYPVGRGQGASTTHLLCDLTRVTFGFKTLLRMTLD